MSPPPPTSLTLERTRLRLILGTITLSLLWVLAVADHSWSDGRTAVALDTVQCAAFAIHIARYRDWDMARLVLFGFVLGIVELAADALCIRYTQTLDYSLCHSAKLGLSPWWMPTAWMIVTTQIGYLGVRIAERLGMARAVLLTAVIGAINIPFYEEMAFHAHWWNYARCRMAALPGQFGSHTPLYVIIAEMVIGASLAPLARIALRRASWPWAAFAGLLGGVMTIIGGLVGYGLMERLL